MGTNFYGKKIPTKKQLEEIADTVLQGKLEIVKEMLEDFETIHIGKSSGGWRFLFDHNSCVRPTFEEYKEWVSEFEITSEYGEKVSQEDFWKLVERKQTEKSSIEKTNHPEWYIIIDGYEFSTSTNFC